MAGKPTSTWRRDRLIGVVAFLVFVAGIATWIVLSRPASTGDAAAVRARATPSVSAAAEPSAGPLAEPPVAAPSPSAAPAAASSAASAAPGPESATEEQVEQSFLTEVADSGMAPPAPAPEQVAMARDACRLMDDGASFNDAVQAFVGIGATPAEADSFVRHATAAFCPVHAPA